MKCEITLLNAKGEAERIISGEIGETLYSALIKAGVSIQAPCGGQGKCGKCRVKASGMIATDPDGTCLCCKTTINGDCTIQRAEHAAQIQLEGTQRQYKTDSESGLGVAVDIGTTTVAAYLCKLDSGRVLASRSMLNPQRSHGADVISRIMFSNAAAGNADMLADEIHTAVTCLSKEMLKAAGLENQVIKKLALVGNTTIMHLTGSYGTLGISKAPYLPDYTAEHIRDYYGIPAVFGGCISGYVGADTVAAMLACGFDETDETVMLIDIGTNGEIALKRNDRIYACSCAAGPAFEGAHIACGIGGVSGAIDHVKLEDGKIAFSTIGGEKPCGICGSGIVDAVACLLKKEEIDFKGRMKDKFYICDSVYIAPEDIREIQLAKAAIASSVEILAESDGINVSDIDKVYLAGGFGTYISIDTACDIGLLPQELNGRIVPVGNAAGDGAKMMLLSQEYRNTAEKLRKNTAYIDLSAQEEFEDIFAEKLLFDD
ncbi:MAG: ASKHA domain-containing protein [Clostridiales bacterium]|nr:ASKHA domain-containing protein [Clostridiales bacterium]